MIRDQTRRMVERFQELMAEKEQHEAVNEDPNRDIGAMIEEIRQPLLSAAEAAGKLNPSHAMCLSRLLDNMQPLNSNKLYVLKEVMSVLLETENRE